jgi:hypothetical protein
MEHCSQFPRTSTWNKASDKPKIRSISGSSNEWLPGKRHKNEPSYSPHALVEEAHGISVAELKRKFGRKELLKAIRDARSVRCQIAGIQFSVYLIHEAHRLPGRRTRWSDIETGNVRLWLICMGCRRRVQNLYLNPRSMLSDSPPIGCRTCFGLRYLSQNSWNRKWWRETAKPLKRLIRKRQLLLRRKHTQNNAEQLELEKMIWIIQKRSKSRSVRGPTKSMDSSQIKRSYRNLNLILA